MYRHVHVLELLKDSFLKLNMTRFMIKTPEKGLFPNSFSLH